MEPGHQEPATASPKHQKPDHKAESRITAKISQSKEPGDKKGRLKQNNNLTNVNKRINLF